MPSIHLLLVCLAAFLCHESIQILGIRTSADKTVCGSLLCDRIRQIIQSKGYMGPNYLSKLQSEEYFHPELESHFTIVISGIGLKRVNAKLKQLSNPGSSSKHGIRYPAFKETRNTILSIYSRLYFKGPAKEMQVKDYAQIHAQHIYRIFRFAKIASIREMIKQGGHVKHEIYRPNNQKFGVPKKGKSVFMITEITFRNPNSKKWIKQVLNRIETPINWKS